MLEASCVSSYITLRTTCKCFSFPHLHQIHFTFRECDAKRQKEEPKSPQPEDTSCDNTLFKLLNMNKQNDVANINLNEIPKELPNFASTLTNLTKTEPELPPIPGYNFIPIDWMLKSKMRIISKHKFKWNGKLKTSEEASGITGFVRCLDTTTSESLDTSMNARSFQCCLVWQHPSLPWVQLFPRCGTKSQGGGPSLVANNQEAIKALHNDWAESFRSLFQVILFTTKIRFFSRSPRGVKLSQCIPSISPCALNLTASKP